MMTIKKFIIAFTYYFYNNWISSFPSYKFRRWYLVHILKYDIHPAAAIHMGCFFTGFYLKIGAHAVLNRNCYLDCREGITIGENASISAECYLITGSHDPQSSDFSGKGGKIFIEDYCWLGARAIVMPGVHFKKGSVAASGAVVTKTVEPFSIVGGNPAKFIKVRSENLRYTLNWFSYFNTDID